MRRFVPVASLATLAVLVGWMAWANYTHVRRDELLAIRAAVSPGMSRADVVQVIKAHVRRTLFQDDSGAVPLVSVQEAGYLGAWILSISFNNDRAVAVHIGDYDDIYRAPPGAPPALVWGPTEQPRPSTGHSR